MVLKSISNLLYKWIFRPVSFLKPDRSQHTSFIIILKYYLFHLIALFFEHDILYLLLNDLKSMLLF